MLVPPIDPLFLSFLDLLAAGSVLGKCHQSQELITWTKQNIEQENDGETSQLSGQPLAAAAMYACVLNQEYDKALDFYDYVLNSPELGASEWQWGGGYGSIHPLLRDLSLVCMGYQAGSVGPLDEGQEEHGESKYPSWTSGDGINTLEQIVQEGKCISLGAFKGVLSMCEVEGNFENAIQILHMIMNYNDKSDWSIVNDSLENFLMENPEPLQIITEDLQSKYLDDDIIARVMNSCNTAGEFGLALLICRLVNSVEEIDIDIGHSVPPIVKKMLLSQKKLRKSDELLTSTMLALSGIGCIKEAKALYSEVVGVVPNDAQSLWQSSIECFDYVSSLNNESDQNWRMAFKNIDRVLYAIESMNDADFVLGESEKQIFSQGVAQMMKSCASAQQGLAGLHLAKYASLTVMKRQNSVSNVKKAIQSFFSLRANDTFDFNDDSNEASSFLSSSDAMLSGAMECYIHSREPKEKEALALFFYKWESDPNLQKVVKSDSSVADNWILSTNDALELLIETQTFESAKSFFESIHPNNRVAETFVIMGKGYAREQAWEEVTKLYVDASKKGFLSEELGILAMEAVAESKLDGKVRILRKIADENASIAGVKQAAWIAKNYWILKRHVGFHYARLLMWWNNPKTTQQQELQLAIKQFQDLEKRGFQVDEDILTCIVKLTKNEQHLRAVNEDDKGEYVKILLKVTLEARQCSLGTRPSFISDTASALIALNASKECTELLRLSVAEGIRVDRESLIDGIKAASAVEDEEAIKEFQILLSQHV